MLPVLENASQGSVLFRFLSQPFQVFNGSCDREGPENGVNTTALLHWELTCDAL